MDPLNRFIHANALGTLALLRLRAENLLERIDNPNCRPVTITAGQREKLNRIASAPKEDDHEFLGHFDFIYEQDEKEGDDQ
jgi:hypothetical protein